MGSAFAGLAGLTSTQRGSFGHQLAQQLQPLGTSSAKKLTPVRLPPGRARLATKTKLDRVVGMAKTIGIVVVAALAASAREGAAGCDDHRDLSANQIGRQRRQPIVVVPAQRYSIATFSPST